MTTTTLPLPMQQAILDSLVSVSFGRYFCTEHEALMIESSNAALMGRAEQHAWRCPSPQCRLEAWT